jgi:hypothetical protein
MSFDRSKVVPTVFWVGFLALGFVTSVGGPNKHRIIDQAAARPARAAVASDAVVARTESPIVSIGVQPAQD